MTNPTPYDDKLPEICATRHDLTGEPIFVKRGEQGYWPAPAGTDPDKWNALQGITKAQENAMKAGSIFGFHIPLADPDCPANQH